jgi:hypothetical protein
MTSVDSSNNIGGASWKNLTPLTGTPAPKSAVPASTPEAAPASIGDRVEVSGTPEAAPQSTPRPLHEKMLVVDGNTVKADTKPQVPVSLLADDTSLGLIGTAGGAGSSHPTTGLGILAQLDETSGVRAIDNGSSNNRFGDLHLVGVNNAAQYLGNPQAMYLGI